MRSPATENLPVINFMLKLREKEKHYRGELSCLRSALANSTERQLRAWRLVARFEGIPIPGNYYRSEVIRIVTGLLAHLKIRHLPHGRSFGAACRQLLDDEERNSMHQADQCGPISRRMQHLFSATRDEVCERVRSLGRRLVEKEATLDFNQLHSDLCHWSENKKSLNLVKARWAADFWGADAEADAPTPEDAP